MRPFATYFEWQWDEYDGARFKRFGRSASIEILLLGIERPDNPANMAGKQIKVGDDRWRPARVVSFYFALPVEILDDEQPEINRLMDMAVADPRHLNWPVIEEILKTADTVIGEGVKR